MKIENYRKIRRWIELVPALVVTAGVATVAVQMVPRMSKSDLGATYLSSKTWRESVQARCKEASGCLQVEFQQFDPKQSSDAPPNMVSVRVAAGVMAADDWKRKLWPDGLPWLAPVVKIVEVARAAQKAGAK